MRKPELLVTAGSLDELERVIRAGANAVIIGDQRFGMRLPGDFTMQEIREAVLVAHNHHAKVYLAVTNIMDNLALKVLPSYLEAIAQYEVDAIVFGDPAVWMLCKQI